MGHHPRGERVQLDQVLYRSRDQREDKVKHAEHPDADQEQDDPMLPDRTGRVGLIRDCSVRTGRARFGWPRGGRHPLVIGRRDSRLW